MKHWQEWAQRQVRAAKARELFKVTIFLVSQCPEGWRVEFKIHAKHPEMIHALPDDDDKKWLTDRLLPVSYRPEWGSVELVRAALALLQASFDEQPFSRWFLLASESCLPIQPLKQVCTRQYL